MRLLLLWLLITSSTCPSTGSATATTIKSQWSSNPELRSFMLVCGTPPSSKLAGDHGPLRSLPACVQSTDRKAQQLNRSKVSERELFRPWWSSPRRGPPLGPQHFGQIRTMQAPLSTRRLDKGLRRNRLFSMAKAGALWSAKISCAPHHRPRRSSLQCQDLALRATRT